MSEAVGWSFAHAAVILKTAGIDRKNGSMAALAGAVNEYFGEEYCGRFMAMCDLNSEALFSGRELDEGKREQMSEFRKITLELVRKKTGALKRIRYQWLDCLY